MAARNTLLGVRGIQNTSKGMTGGDQSTERVSKNMAGGIRVLEE